MTIAPFAPLTPYSPASFNTLNSETSSTGIVFRTDRSIGIPSTTTSGSLGLFRETLARMRTEPSANVMPLILRSKQ